MYNSIKSSLTSITNTIINHSFRYKYLYSLSFNQSIFISSIIISKQLFSHNMSTRTSKRKLDQLNSNNNSTASSTLSLSSSDNVEQLNTNKKSKIQKTTKVKKEKETKVKVKIAKETKVDSTKKKTSSTKSKSKSTETNTSSDSSSQSYINYDPITRTCAASEYDGKHRCWPNVNSKNVNMINYHDTRW